MMRRALVSSWFVIFWTGILASSGSFAAEMLLERGAYLMRGPVACGNCHSPWTEEGRVVDMEFAGGVEIPTEGFTAFPSNNHAGPGDWYRPLDRRPAHRSSPRGCAARWLDHRPAHAHRALPTAVRP